MRQFACVMLLLILAGCQTAAPAPQATLSYADLVARHNQRVKGIDRFWSRAIIEMRWTDADGVSRLEQGEGHLVLDLPLHSLLTLGKLGQIRLYAGSNETYFWLFDELDDTQKKLYIGRHDGRPDATLGPARQRSPLPLKPVDLPRLLGIVRIADDAERLNAGKVEWIDSRYVLTPPGENVRYHLSPISFRVEKVELLDDAGKVALGSKLSEPERMEKENAAVGPFMATRIHVETPGQEGGITLHLSGMTDEKRKVNPRVFDLDAIKAARQPDVVIPVAP